jgi:hypothetical protein
VRFAQAARHDRAAPPVIFLENNTEQRGDDLIRQSKILSIVPIGSVMNVINPTISTALASRLPDSLPTSSAFSGRARTLPWADAGHNSF